MTAKDFKDSPETVSAYDEAPLWSTPFGELLLREIPMGSGWKALDLGCGTGFPALELAERLGGTCQVVGLDPWPNALERARRKSLAYGVSNVHWVMANAESMPFPDGAFDLVVSNIGLNNWEKPGKVAAECGRVMKPGGFLGLTTNPQGHWREFYALMRDVFTRFAGSPGAVERLNRQEAHRMTHEGAVALFTGAGFTPSRRVHEEAVFRYLDAGAFLEHHFVGWGFLQGWRDAAGPGLWDRVLPEIERALDALPRDRGAFRLTVPVEYWEFAKNG